MDKRKVGQLGASSLVVSLPKPWIRFVGIKKGDCVWASQQGLNLILSPKESRESRRKAIVIADTTDGAVIEVFARYIQGFDSVVLKKLKRVDLSKTLEAVDSHLLGVQVIQETKQDVVLQVFTREEHSLPRLLKRLKFVFKNLFSLIYAKDFELSKARVLLKSAFKIYFLCQRTVYNASYSSRVFSKSKLTIPLLLSYALVLKNASSVLDEVAGLFRSAEGACLPSSFDELTRESTVLYLTCFDAFLKNEKTVEWGEVRRERNVLLARANELFLTESPKTSSEKDFSVLVSAFGFARDCIDRAGELMELASNVAE